MDSYLVIRALLVLALAVFTFNAFLGIYVMVKYMYPQRVGYKIMWLFYFCAITLCVMQIVLTVFLLIVPEGIPSCFKYQKGAVSVIYCFTCSAIVSCGFIAATTMQQIRVSIKVILKEIPLQIAQRKIKVFAGLLLAFWICNQIGSVTLIFMKGEGTDFPTQMIV